MKATGSTIGYADSSTSGSPTLITSVVGLDLPEISTEDIDVSTLDSANLKYHAGDIEPGEASASIIYDKTQYGTLYGLIGTTKWWTFTMPDSGVKKCEGYIKGLKITPDRKNGVTVDISFKLSGAATFTAT